MLGWLSGSKPCGQAPLYYDPIYCLYKLVKLNFREPDTKLSFSNHAITFDHAGSYQGAKRFISGTIWGGSSGSDLNNLTMPLHYAIMILDPANNPSVRLPFFLAWRGLHSLAESYEREDEKAVVANIRNQMAMIEDAFLGQSIRRHEEHADWANSPLLNLSKDIWADTLPKVNKLYMQALVQYLGGASESRKDLEWYIKKAEETQLHLIEKIREAVANFANGITAVTHGNHDFCKIMATEKKSHAAGIAQKRTSYLSTIYTHLWPNLFAKLTPADRLDFWKNKGIPIETVEDHQVPPAAFWEWLGLLPTSPREMEQQLMNQDSSDIEIKVETPVPEPVKQVQVPPQNTGKKGKRR